MRDLFWLDGVCCADYNIQLQGPMTFSGARPKGETVSIPGRNGDLFFPDGSYSNVTGLARCFVLDAENVSLKFNAIIGWIMKTRGYRRLEVSHEPETYRLARVVLSPANETRMYRLAPFEISFDCKPQKYFKSGQMPIVFTTSGDALYNNHNFIALPFITVRGSGAGTLTIGGATMTLSDCNGIVLDCETQDAYRGAENMNSTVIGEFPALGAGQTDISWTGGITAVEIRPRWWCL